MKALFWGVVLAVLAGAAALIASESGGNVVFFVPPLRVDVSLNFFLMSAVVLFLLVFWVARVVQKAVDFPARVAAYRQRRTEIGSSRALREALRSLFEGRFARAERAAQVAQRLREIAGLSALVGARAAHRMHEHARRDEWLARAADDRSMDTARLATSAELWTDSREAQRALDAIVELQAGGGRHIQIARVALAANLQVGRWDEVLKLVRPLAKRRALHDAAVRRLKMLAYREKLQDARHDASVLLQTFESIPLEDRRMVEITLEGARLLNLAGRGRTAADAIEVALEARWDERLLDEYARAQALPVRERLERATAWLQRYPQDPALLRCLGLLCLREQLWGNARMYLMESLRLRVHPATSLALARLAEQTDQGSEAAVHFREAALGFSRLAQDASADAQRGAARIAGRDAAASGPIA
ncbi:MAG TPA: heme biosynthesis HemY N-terminal domain-containing protein [Burkholderiaceae bacterium]|nr:heme biosynthesis HemY N-terminal domain-containing protein [Burkholderiaceae bacterium]